MLVVGTSIANVSNCTDVVAQVSIVVEELCVDINDWVVAMNDMHIVVDVLAEPLEFRIGDRNYKKARFKVFCNVNCVNIQVNFQSCVSSLVKVTGQFAQVNFQSCVSRFSQKDREFPNSPVLD